MVFGKNWGLGFVYPQTLGAKEFPSIAFFLFPYQTVRQKGILLFHLSCETRPDLNVRITSSGKPSLITPGKAWVLVWPVSPTVTLGNTTACWFICTPLQIDLPPPPRDISHFIGLRTMSTVSGTQQVLNIYLLNEGRLPKSPLFKSRYVTETAGPKALPECAFPGPQTCWSLTPANNRRTHQGGGPLQPCLSPGAHVPTVCWSQQPIYPLCSANRNNNNNICWLPMKMPALLSNYL